MLVLVLGQRLGLARGLKKLKIPYLLWNESPVKNKLSAEIVVIKPFPGSIEELQSNLKRYNEVTHVIASTEKAVIPSSLIRRWLNLRRNPHSLILKCTDKFKMKTYLFKNDIPMTEFCSIKEKEDEQLIKDFGFPIVMKPKLSSGGRGITFIRSKEELKNSKSSGFYFEPAIKGSEGSVESFVVDNKIVFSNITQYYKHGLCNKLPGRYSDLINKKILDLNSMVIKALKIKWGMTHLEFYLTEDKVLFGEIALRPLVVISWEALGLAYNFNAWEVFIKVELDILNGSDFSQKNYSSSIVIYPNTNIVSKIEGIEEIEKLKSFKKMKLKLKVNDVIGKREGIGQDYGYALLGHNSAEQLDNDIDEFYSLLSF